MRRAIVVGVLLVAVGVALSAAGGQSGGRRYTAVFDNAFGLIPGADVKVAGVRAGVIEHVRLDRRTLHALVDMRIDEPGLGSLRSDATCSVRPQSLLGEYFVDCTPGTSPAEIPVGGTIPVTRTQSTIPADLVNSIMRRPVRERFGIVIGELGAAAAGNGANLSAALRRADPALRETDRVLASLAGQRRELAGLISDSQRVLGELAAARKGLGRWASAAHDTAAATAARRDDVRTGTKALPGFLAELQPSLRSLSQAASAGAPAVHTLSAAAPALDRLLGDVTPLAQAMRPALRSLGRAGAAATPALRTALPDTKALRSALDGLPELATNAEIITRFADSRDSAVMDDLRSPGGRGFTTLESALQFVHTLATLTNLYDGETHILKAALFEGACMNYQDAAHVKADPALFEQCASVLGPNQPGVTTPDTTAPAPGSRARRHRGSEPARGGQRRERAAKGPGPRAQQPLRDLLDGLAKPAVPRTGLPFLDYLFGT